MLKSLEYLKIKLAQKNIITISGNVSDIYGYQKHDNKNPEQKMFVEKDLKGIIRDFAEQEQYKILEYFSPSFGGLNLLNQSNKDEYKPIDCPNLDAFLDRIIEQTTDIIDEDGNMITHTKGIYVINFADSYFDSNNNQNMYLEKLISLLAQFLDSKKIETKFDENADLREQDKLVFITRDPNHLFKDIYQNNIEYAEVMIKKPNINERRDLIKYYAASLRTQDANLFKQNSVALEKVVALTDKLSCIEIAQFGRIRDKSQTFVNRYNLVNFNKQESEWEKINFNKIRELKEHFKNRVKGQDYAIEQININLINSFLGLNGLLYNESRSKPKGILFFVGPTGTGKTEISKTLAEFVFGNESKLIRFDMSEYNHEHSDQRLIGAPPGYVGYDSGGELTNKVKEHPFSILLFDEIEKAHPRILDKFLQILEDGRLTSSKGELIDFSETFIIFTSNIGTNKIDSSKDELTVRRQFVTEVRKHFIENMNRPELLNRIGEKNIVPFNYITDWNIIRDIVLMKIKQLFNKINNQYNLKINYDKAENDFIEFIKNKSDEKMGARGIINVIDSTLTTSVSQFIFDNYEFIQERIKEDKIIFAEMIIQNKNILIDLIND
ncbi:AAA family ATPase [Ureaplasma sp. ES3154-GEN]|uniref:AAA family ATPase n=1 Tax=Ureaplasma sp. ES3154-GEN TaxID=2984844 RepID=UPI0021E7FCB2|nr:AAA family ATPase [Ureaplasma sp. ES3154-GEN]MCV3743550.1 AAA family ATPase [Ureaplasma sp. ES3154-GEN]